MSGLDTIGGVQPNGAVPDERDLHSDGHDVAESHDTFEDAEVPDDISIVPRAQLPADVMADLIEIERNELIEKARVGAEDRVPVEDTRVAPYKTVVKLFTSYAKGGQARGVQAR